MNQIYRGDPERKILYLVDDFSGGVNTVDVDGVIRDNEFRKLVNVELSQKGLAQNRKGFKYLNMFAELLDDLEISLPNPTHLFKIIRDTGNLLENINEFSYIEVQETQEQTDWTHTPTSQTLTLSDFYTSISGQEHDLCVLMANAYGVYSLKITKDKVGVIVGEVKPLKIFNKIYDTDVEILETSVELPNPYITYDLISGFASYDYYKLTIDYGAETNFFIVINDDIIKNVNLFNVSGVNVTVVRDDNDGLTITNNTGASIYYSWTGINVKPTKTNIKTVDYGDKVYFSTSDIINSEDAIVVYDVITNTVSYIDKNNCYSPNAYDIMNFAKDLGFNMLSANPISNIDMVDTTLKTFQTIWITNTAGSLLPKIPKNGQFIINLLTTGSTLSPYEVKIILKNHLDEELVYTTYSVSSDGSVFKYTFDGASITGFSNALSISIDIEWKPLDIEVDGLVNVSPKFYPKSVVDNSIIYIIENDSYYKRYFFGNGYTFTSYGLLDIETSIEDEDPFTADPTSLFSAYMSETTYSGKYFEIYNAVSEEKILYQYQNLGTTFVPVYRSDIDGFTFGIVDNVCPLKYSIFKDTITSKYYVVTNISASSITYSELTNYNENDLILSLLGQNFEVGTSNPQVLTGIDLTNIHIMEINGRMIYYKGNTIWFSDLLGNFSYVPNNNFEILPINVNDEIVSINFFRGSYIIFTKDRIYKMGDYNSSEFSITLVTDFVGAISANSIRAVENSLYFLSKKGLYRLVLNYYVESYENLQRIDEKVIGEIPISSDSYSLLYNSQYWLVYNDEDVDTVKYYYNVELPNKRHPFTFDIYAKKPDLLVPHNLNLLAIKDNRLYVFDNGYTDFYYDDSLDVDDYIPIGEIELPSYLLGTPTHNKKFKSIYIKTYCDRIVPLYLTVKVDGYVKIDPKSYTVSLSPVGEVLYTIIDDSNVDLKKDLLGNFIIGKDKLGDGYQSVHKLVVANKGKAIQINFKFKTQNYFGIANIGILYKLGKVKENR